MGSWRAEGVRRGLIPLAMLGLTPGGAGAQSTVVTPDLRDIAATDGWSVFNRDAETRAGGVYLDARPGFGMAWFDGVELSEGAVEVTLQGRNRPQASFLGVAFRGLDDETFEAVYFRPFNFQASDSLARSHSVQYVAHPRHTWQQLRAASPGAYEAAISPPLDPDGAFAARIEFTGTRVRVFVNGAREPCLDVPALGARQVGRVGLWVGNGSDGLFSGLRILAP